MSLAKGSVVLCVPPWRWAMRRARRMRRTVGQSLGSLPEPARHWQRPRPQRAGPARQGGETAAARAAPAARPTGIRSLRCNGLRIGTTAALSESVAAAAGVRVDRGSDSGSTQAVALSAYQWRPCSATQLTSSEDQWHHWHGTCTVMSDAHWVAFIRRRALLADVGTEAAGVGGRRDGRRNLPASGGDAVTDGGTCLPVG